MNKVIFARKTAWQSDISSIVGLEVFHALDIEFLPLCISYLVKNCWAYEMKELTFR